jgi:hypothetical protein
LRRPCSSPSRTLLFSFLALFGIDESSEQSDQRPSLIVRKDKCEGDEKEYTGEGREENGERSADSERAESTTRESTMKRGKRRHNAEYQDRATHKRVHTRQGIQAASTTTLPKCEQILKIGTD